MNSISRLTNKRILLGVTGGIAAYKAAELIRRIKEAGADVRVVMTSAAQEFITPLTLQALSGNPVHTQLLDPSAEAAMGHIELAKWADLVVVAPASANFMAKLANGQADELLNTLCLATTSKIALAPAMNQAMWKDLATQTNLKTLINRSVIIFGPAEGAQACGDVGPGRMLEPELLVRLMAEQFQSSKLDAVRVVITAGPTREAIDPVRYISNHSSGKMGFALAEACIEAGAVVTLIAGPVSLATPKKVKRIDVESAQQMYDATMNQMSKCDIFIATAAVADYRPVSPANQKIKKNADIMNLELVRNKDIVASVCAIQPSPFTIGFAAETQNVTEYARGKLNKKKLDMIIANDVSNSDIGFNSDNNAVSVFWEKGEKSLPIKSKQQLSRDLITEIADHFYETSN